MVYYGMRKLFLSLLAISCAVCTKAEVRLPNVLSSNMVLQQQSTAKLWGWCEAGERIAVTTSWNGQVDSARGTRDGKWSLFVKTPAAGGPYTIHIKGANTIDLDNILIGEVWVCSGQSNMEMCETWGVPDVKAELPNCYNDKIRFFHVPRTTAFYPQENCLGAWKACDSNELKTFSAVAYFFGKKLNKELNVPIGLIEVAWGGTPAECWTPADWIDHDNTLKAAAAKLQPANGWPDTAGYCFNGMIAPITDFSVAGALWYQGEGNTIAPHTYAKLLGTMITAWRDAWRLPLPFYYVQIAPFKYGVPDQGSVLREQQAKVMQQVLNTGMVVISDLVDDTADIHPKDKHDVGIRLAAWALSNTYHAADIPHKGPAYDHMEVKGDKVVVAISDDAKGGLVLKGAEVRELFIAGEDKVFYPAKVRIDEDNLIVSAAAVKKPIAVRYQFNNSGIGNISSRSGLPLAPFRTDDWAVSADQ
jgi:sialate O-acetylesterase